MGADQIVWSLSNDLGKDFTRTLAVRQMPAKADNANGQVPAALAGESPMDVKARLLRLENLRQKGLINEDGYKLHKAEITPFIRKNDAKHG